MKICTGILVCAFLAFATQANAQPKVEPDSRNLVASRIEGEWEIDVELSQRLNGKPSKSGGQMSIVSDPTALEKLPQKLAAEIEKQKVRIYLAGVLKEGRQESLFFLTVLGGNTVIGLCRKGEGGQWKESGDAAVMIATGRNRQDDLMLICESYEEVGKAEKPSVAYRRVKPAAKE